MQEGKLIALVRLKFRKEHSLISDIILVLDGEFKVTMTGKTINDNGHEWHEMIIENTGHGWVAKHRVSDVGEQINGNYFTFIPISPSIKPVVIQKEKLVPEQKPDFFIDLLDMTQSITIDQKTLIEKLLENQMELIGIVDKVGDTDNKVALDFFERVLNGVKKSAKV